MRHGKVKTELWKYTSRSRLPNNLRASQIATQADDTGGLLSFWDLLRSSEIFWSAEAWFPLFSMYKDRVTAWCWQTLQRFRLMETHGEHRVQRCSKMFKGQQIPASSAGQSWRWELKLWTNLCRSMLIYRIYRYIYSLCSKIWSLA